MSKFLIVFIAMLLQTYCLVCASTVYYDDINNNSGDGSGEDEQGVVEEEAEVVEEKRTMGRFFVDHATAMKIPNRVQCFTTNDLYREGYRQPFCEAMLANNYSGLNVTDEQRLTCFLLHNYSTSVRPVGNKHSILVVNFSLAINQIFDLDDRNQQLLMNVWFEETWHDESLVWNPADFGGVTMLNIPSFYIFIPDIELYNTGGDYSKRRAQFRTMVTYDGTVFYGNPAKLTSTCAVNPTWFPFDTQVCHLKFGSWTHSGLEIDLQPSRDSVDVSRLITHGKWDVVEVIQKRHSVVYSCCQEPYIDISYYVILKRKPLYYLLNVYFFTFLLGLMTVAVYPLPIDSGEKCGLGSAVLFSVSVFMLSLGEKLPESSDYVPIVNVYLFIIMAMSAVSLMITIGIHAIHFQHPCNTADGQKPQIRPIPDWVMPFIDFYRRKRPKWVRESVNENLIVFNKKKDIIRKLKSCQRLIDFEMRHLSFTRCAESPPFLPRQRKSPTNLSELTPSKTPPPRIFSSNSGSLFVQLANITEESDFYQVTLANQINEINTAIDYLTDNYDWEITHAFRLILWHELADFFDTVLFWIFLVVLFGVILLVFVFASIATPDVKVVIEKLQPSSE